MESYKVNYDHAFLVRIGELGVADGYRRAAQDLCTLARDRESIPSVELMKYADSLLEYAMKMEARANSEIKSIK